jgi:hypothetical protein
MKKKEIRTYHHDDDNKEPFDPVERNNFVHDEMDRLVKKFNKEHHI